MEELRFKTIEELIAYNQAQMTNSPFGNITIPKVEFPSEKDYFKRITHQCQPHQILHKDFLSYGTLNFPHTFLPHVPHMTGKAVDIFDGAELFYGNQNFKRDLRTLRFQETNLITLLFYTYPKGVMAETRKNRVDLAKYETLAFLEIDENNAVEVHFRFGDNFIKFLREHFKDIGKMFVASQLENAVYRTTKEGILDFFTEELTHNKMMCFIFRALGIEETVEGIRSLEKALENARLAFEPEVEADCEDNFLEEFETFLKDKGLDQKPATPPDYTIQFYRSEDHAKNRISMGDKGYTGQFGFDRYHKIYSGSVDNDLTTRYFPNVVGIEATYKVPFLCLWPPKNALKNNIELANIIDFNTFTPVNEAEVWVELEKISIGDATKNASNIYFDTGTDKVKIQVGNTKQEKGLIPVQNKKGNFRISCEDILTDYVHIIFRTDSADGKIAGLLHIVPNQRVYTTEISLVDVHFTNKLPILPNQNTPEFPLTVSNTNPHLIAKDFQNYLNTNCFNQALIYCKVLPEWEALYIEEKDNDILKQRTGSAGYYYLARRLEEAFAEMVKKQYNSSKSSRVSADIDDIIQNQTKEKVEKSRQRLVGTSTTAITYFQKMYKNSKKKAGKYNKFEFIFTKNGELAEKFRAYHKAFEDYKEALFAETKTLLENNYPEYLNYLEDIRAAINRLQSLGSVSLDKNKITVFLDKDIYAFQPKEGGIIGGYTPTGQGQTQILNYSLTNQGLRNELIAHELGHTLNLGHPFPSQEDKEEIQKEYKEEIKKIKDGKNNNQKTENPIETDYKTFKSGIESLKEIAKNRPLNSMTTSELWQWLNWLDIVFGETWINKALEKEQKSQGKTTTITLSEEDMAKQAAEDKRKIKELREAEKEALAELAVLRQKGKSAENFMDYFLVHTPKRKSFWYWQWRKMWQQACNTTHKHLKKIDLIQEEND